MSGMQPENPFKKLIDGMESLDKLTPSSIQTRDVDGEYVDSLIARYGLPPDKNSKAILLLLVKKMHEGKNIPGPLYIYLYAFVLDQLKAYDNPIEAALSFLKIGMTLNEIMAIIEDQE